MKIKKAIQKKLTKKQQKREKQRAINLLRAEKMYRLRINGVKEVPFNEELPRINIGCSGWFYWHWRGRLYPHDKPTSEWFKIYAKHFETVELNASFYNWPTPGIIRSWQRQAEDNNFIYTVKVPELITHIKQFKATQGLIKDFCYVADQLGNRVGCLIFQLPPSFNYTPAKLKAIVTQLEPNRRNVVEFRHASWWNETVYKAFEKANIIFCSSSAPRLPDELIKTSDEVYIRFHGPERWYRHDYSKRELQEWIQKIEESGAQRVWAYFNNDYEGNAPRNAELFYRLLQKAKLKSLIA